MRQSADPLTQAKQILATLPGVKVQDASAALRSIRPRRDYDNDFVLTGLKLPAPKASVAGAYGSNTLDLPDKVLAVFAQARKAVHPEYLQILVEHAGRVWVFDRGVLIDVTDDAKGVKGAKERPQQTMRQNPAKAKSRTAHSDVLEFGQREHWLPGTSAYYEYRCTEAHDIPDTPTWYHSHQAVTVLGPELSNETWDLAKTEARWTYADRESAGLPKSYYVRHADGYEHTAYEDELLVSPQFYERGDPPMKSERVRVLKNPARPVFKNPVAQELYDLANYGCEHQKGGCKSQSKPRRNPEAPQPVKKEPERFVIINDDGVPVSPAYEGRRAANLMLYTLRQMNPGEELELAEVPEEMVNPARPVRRNPASKVWVRKDALAREDGAPYKNVTIGTRVVCLRNTVNTSGATMRARATGVVLESGAANVDAAKRATGTTAAMLVQVDG